MTRHLFPACLALVACTASSPDAPIGGDYKMSTLAVSDSCLDGALEALFMPEGPGQPHDFEFPLYLPTDDELPLTYDVDFREPFVGMTVTVIDGDPGRTIRDSVMPAVLLNSERYGDCVVTMTVDADLIATGSDTLQGSALIALSDPRGDDGRCPPFDADPCDVTLTLLAERIGS